MASQEVMQKWKTIPFLTQIHYSDGKIKDHFPSFGGGGGGGGGS